MKQPTVHQSAKLGVVTLLGFLLLLFLGLQAQWLPVEAETREVEASPSPEPTTSPTPSPTPVMGSDVDEVQSSEVVSEIRRVFGEHSSKAFLLLQGNGDGTCAENRHLDPDAVNDNTWWGGVGQDIGIFQINTYYHPVEELNLWDYKNNIAYAWRMFENDNYSFTRWTCGKVYGI